MYIFFFAIVISMMQIIPVFSQPTDNDLSNPKHCGGTCVPPFAKPAPKIEVKGKRETFPFIEFTDQGIHKEQAADGNRIVPSTKRDGQGCKKLAQAVADFKKYEAQLIKAIAATNTKLAIIQYDIDVNMKKIENYQSRIDNKEFIVVENLHEAYDNIRDGLGREFLDIVDPRNKSPVSNIETAKNAMESLESSWKAYEALMDAETLPDKIQELVSKSADMKSQMERLTDFQARFGVALVGAREAREQAEQRIRTC